MPNDRLNTLLGFGAFAVLLGCSFLPSFAFVVQLCQHTGEPPWMLPWDARRARAAGSQQASAQVRTGAEPCTAWWQDPGFGCQLLVQPHSVIYRNDQKCQLYRTQGDGAYICSGWFHLASSELISERSVITFIQISTQLDAWALLDTTFCVALTLAREKILATGRQCTIPCLQLMRVIILSFLASLETCKLEGRWTGAKNPETYN